MRDYRSVRKRDASENFQTLILKYIITAYARRFHLNLSESARVYA